MAFILIVGIGIAMLIVANIITGLLIGVFGNDFHSFFGRAYTKNPRSTFDKGLNNVFFVMHAIPYFSYISYMKKHSYWKARMLYLIWLFGFNLLCIIVAVIIGLFLEVLGY
ncbi:hypothetical protein PQ478_05005 [Alkalihalophilus pseudofirmus]|uniref:hypothetical protein n=1 Tax=Alkalihalophilus pseudofirmus TaxID=79885 RepID=UPI00259B6FEA|nr:hypothetical protein [Alkalihalophilus pseudofirmus]WEG17855.1 hypothetical protein PQ478_05005 [Alkalihalophilus pseudofirmus]